MVAAADEDGTCRTWHHSLAGRMAQEAVADGIPFLACLEEAVVVDPGKEMCSTQGQKEVEVGGVGAAVENDRAEEYDGPLSEFAAAAAEAEAAYALGAGNCER